VEDEGATSKVTSTLQTVPNLNRYCPIAVTFAALVVIREQQHLGAVARISFRQRNGALSRRKD
jgi:hypothetical protein